MSPEFKRYGAFLVIGIGIGLLLYDGCAPKRITEKHTTSRTIDTQLVFKYDTVRVHEAYAVIKWRDRTPVAQIDSSRGRRDTVLVCEPFTAAWSGIDSTNGASASGRIQYPPMRITDLIVACPPDTSMIIRDSVHVEIVREHHPSVALGVGLFAGINRELNVTYGAGVTASFIIASW